MTALDHMAMMAISLNRMERAAREAAEDLKDFKLAYTELKRLIQEQERIKQEPQ